MQLRASSSRKTFPSSTWAIPCVSWLRFQGDVIRRHGASNRETFTVRKISFSVGVERTFPLHSPRLDKITVLRRGKVRRAKLYYLRNLSGKAAKIKEK